MSTIAPEFLSTHALSTQTSLSSMLDARCHVVPERLLTAMRYALMAGGKRVRPALMLECYRAFGGNVDSLVMPIAMSVECMHTYSLIHDDLPCMDDDDWRRGMPSCHRKFDEATAILAADALQSLSFELLAQADVDADARLRLLSKLAVAAGAQGMAGGQIMDMQTELSGVQGVLEVERIHIHKTGALIRYCCEAGALLADASPQQQAACSHYGAAVGLLFQIADDILDATASSNELGKSSGKDASQQKATYVSVLGLRDARLMAENMRDTAVEAANQFGPAGKPLAQLAEYILERRT